MRPFPRKTATFHTTEYGVQTTAQSTRGTRKEEMIITYLKRTVCTFWHSCRQLLPPFAPACRRGNNTVIRRDGQTWLRRPCESIQYCIRTVLGSFTAQTTRGCRQVVPVRRAGGQRGFVSNTLPKHLRGQTVLCTAEHHYLRCTYH